ncbi:MAG: M28 family peptidase [Armatimonadota bacterium]|nr:M28 family peptidase [Armatimonadota bacterium]MDR7537646.1 M28 family peptidase [Armatimonadota bacterium]
MRTGARAVTGRRQVGATRRPAAPRARASAAGPGDIVAQVSLDRMWRDLEFLCGFDRTSGTAGERRAMDYIAQRLRADGIRVDVHEFDAYLSYPREGRIEVLAGDGLPAQIPAKTRSFSGVTPPEGITAEVVSVPGGVDLFRDTETHRRLDADLVAGKIVLSEAGSRRNMQAAQERGAVAYLHMWPSDEEAIHEGIVSPVWGAPTPETVQAFPRIPILGITKGSGEALRAALARGPVRLRLHSRVESGWRRVTLPVAYVPGRTEEFVLFSGHVDSWHLGATDNATGNAVTMEVARLLHGARARLHRGVRCAFWPGHSTGRYAGSTWYADRFWAELAEHCILHINCDSPGVVGATSYDPITATADVAAFGVALIRERTGQTVGWERPVRAGDQSFWGAGVPSLFMGLSVRPPGQRWHVGGSGLGWWWHTEADTLDKVDPQILRLDAQIYLAAAYRFAAEPLPPQQVAPAVLELRQVVAGLQHDVGERFDLSPVAAALDRLAAQARRFDRAVAAAAQPGGAPPRRVEALARARRAAIRALVQVGYVGGNPFDHDPAVPQRPLPALADARDLAQMDPTSHEARVLATRLVRRRNQVAHTLQTAAAALDAVADTNRFRRR